MRTPNNTMPRKSKAQVAKAIPSREESSFSAGPFYWRMPLPPAKHDLMQQVASFWTEDRLRTHLMPFVQNAPASFLVPVNPDDPKQGNVTMTLADWYLVRYVHDKKLLVRLGNIETARDVLSIAESAVIGDSVRVSEVLSSHTEAYTRDLFSASCRGALVFFELDGARYRVSPAQLNMYRVSSVLGITDLLFRNAKDVLQHMRAFKVRVQSSAGKLVTRVKDKARTGVRSPATFCVVQPHWVRTGPCSPARERRYRTIVGKPPK